MAKKLRVGVIFGGRSGEHEVSLISAASVMRAMDRDKYEIIPIGITKKGQLIASGDPLKALKDGGPQEDSSPVAILSDTSQRALIQLERSEGGISSTHIRRLDVVIPILHGPYGEDGTVQGLLELADIPYVGCGVAASALGMDKALMKALFQVKGLPVVEHMAVKRRDWEANPERTLQAIEGRFSFPCFVKPANLGSSVGVSKVHHRGELPQAVNLAARYDRKILVERAIDAREIECSVLGNDEPIASVLGEIIPSREFYDYRAKYIDGESKLIIPAKLPEALARHIRELAIQAFLALDCAGMARVDFLLDKETNEVYLSELNTIPGFTPISMYPKLWEASGISYPELIDRLIELALERYADKSRNQTTYSEESLNHA